MIDRQTYQRLLTAHGRRVANRAAVSEIEPDQRDLSMFYAMHGSEARLPEDERCRTGMIDRFDPTGWHAFYDNHPCDPNSVMYSQTGGTSEHWFDQLLGAEKTWGKWVLAFIHMSLVLGKDEEVFDSIADDQGEFQSDEGCRFCRWWPHWHGWAAWAESVSDQDIRVLKQVFAWIFRLPQRIPKHPEPGSPEAEAFLKTVKS